MFGIFKSIKNIFIVSFFVVVVVVVIQPLSKILHMLLSTSR